MRHEVKPFLDPPVGTRDRLRHLTVSSRHRLGGNHVIRRSPFTAFTTKPPAHRGCARRAGTGLGLGGRATQRGLGRSGLRASASRA